MADQVGIVNMALGHLGDLTKVKRLASFTRAAAGNNTAHNAALDFYDEAKSQMHACVDWARARKVKALSVHADSPVLSGLWTYKYTRPPDCLIFRKVIDDSGTEYEWEPIIEERITGSQTYNDEYIYCNEPDVLGWYTVLIGEDLYMPGMAELHSLILAQKLAMTVTAKIDVRLALTRELQARVERLCGAMGNKEGYVENEAGSNAYTELM
jgi:hypothetical protein